MVLEIPYRYFKFILTKFGKKIENWVYIHIRYTVLSKDLYLRRLLYVQLTKIDISF
jgi:hypothetical protein